MCKKEIMILDEDASLKTSMPLSDDWFPHVAPKRDFLLPGFVSLPIHVHSKHRSAYNKANLRQDDIATFKRVAGMDPNL